MGTNGQMIMAQQSAQNMGIAPMNYGGGMMPNMQSNLQNNMGHFGYNANYTPPYTSHPQMMMNPSMMPPQFNLYQQPMYNPYNLMGQPINNYNRPGNYGGGPMSMPMQMPMMGGNYTPMTSGVNSYTGYGKTDNSFNVNNNQPIKVLTNHTSNNHYSGNNITSGTGLSTIPENTPASNRKYSNIIGSNANNNINTTQNQNISQREQDKARVKRSMSTKRTNNDSSYLSHKNSYIDENQNKNGPSTNPESFSRIRNTSARSRIDSDGQYKPYSLKDYKKLENVKIELGRLGPNIGTKEWEEKQEKMKKMDQYANLVCYLCENLAYH